MTKELVLKIAAWVWLLVVVIVTLFAINSKPTFDSSIMSLLPIPDQKPLVQQAIKQVSADFYKRLIVLVTAENDAKAQAATAALAMKLELLPEVAQVNWTADIGELNKVQQELLPYRFSLLESGSRQLLLDESFEKIESRALSNLYSPLARRISVVDDPFGLFGMNLNRKSALNIQVSNSLFKVSGASAPTYMLAVTIVGDPFLPVVQQGVLGLINEQSSLFNASGVSLRMSGMLLHAEAGAKQASQEISTIGLGSLLGIVVVMLWVFRQVKPLLLMMLPLLLGSLVGASITMLVFGKVHLITLAFGAGLVGVSIDYALHFLCVRLKLPSKKVLKRILPGLLLGLFSSVIAYAAQSYAPFPGLQQMAVFSVVGLSASCLTVILWFPLLTAGRSATLPAVMLKFDVIRRDFFQLNKHAMSIMILIIICGFSIKTIIDSASIDDVRLLQTSPKSMLAEDKDVQRLLGGTSSSQFLLVQGATLEECLQKEERLAPLLNNLIERGLVDGFQALSAHLPSLNRQRQNKELIKQLYTERLASFFDRLNISGQKLIETHEVLKRSEGAVLTPSLWFELKESRMWGSFVVDHEDDSVATIIRFSGVLDKTIKAHLIKISENETGVDFVDQVQNISDVLTAYRSKVMRLLLVAYLGVFLVLLLRYKKDVWRVILPSMLASIITLALLVWLENGLNLFHIMALILVLGIGLDMGIFLIETGGESHTWLAVSLSTYTSLLAFGLLAFSDTPVLHHYGVTVLIGLVCVFFLTLGMRKNTIEEIDS